MYTLRGCGAVDCAVEAEVGVCAVLALVHVEVLARHDGEDDWED